MRRLAVLLALVATPAAAALAPQYYEAARRDAPDVVAFQVVHIQMPREALGTCTVGARVIRVERGSRYAVGDDLAVAIPCRRAGATVPSSGAVWQDMDALGLSRFGRAFLDAGGQPALDQYEILDGPDDEGVLR